MNRFTKKAQDYLLTKTLCAGEKKYHLAEIEFYEYSEEHPDTFTHRHPQQQTHLQFYFHRASKKATSKYRGGTFKGLDITFSPNEKDYCGILIRSLQDVSTGETIEGPCRCVHQILKDTDCKTIYELVDQIDLSVRKEDSLCLTEKKVVLKRGILSGPRIGLKSKTEHQKDYVDRRYRFVLEGAKVRKKKKTLLSF